MRCNVTKFHAVGWLALIGCSDPKCLPTERKVGETCYQVTASRDASVPADAGARADPAISGDAAASEPFADSRRDAASANTTDEDAGGISSADTPGRAGSSSCVGDAVACDAGTQTGTSGAATKVVSIALGTLHACAVLSDGHVKCWGSNHSGELGSPVSSFEAPKLVDGIENAVQVAAGYQHSCVRVKDGSVSCWGSNEYGQLGMAAVAATFLSPQTLSIAHDIRDLVAGDDYTCAAHNNGEVTCWGAGNDPAQVPYKIASITDAVKLDVGTAHACAVTSVGEVKCWGRNSNGPGELGNGTNQDSQSAVAASTPPQDATDVATGDAHSCAVIEGGVQCWGSNVFGQLGYGPVPGASMLPQAVPSLSSVKAICAGPENTCALLASGTVSCWGAVVGTAPPGGDDVRQITPTSVPALANVTQVQCGGEFCCALLENGTVSCWGDNTYARELGVPNLSMSQNPVAVPGLI